MINESKETEAVEGMVDGPELLRILWPDEKVRPSLGWLKYQEKRRTIPFIRIGRLIFYFPSQVRAAIAQRHTVQPRRVQSALP